MNMTIQLNIQRGYWHTQDKGVRMQQDNTDETLQRGEWPVDYSAQGIINFMLDEGSHGLPDIIKRLLAMEDFSLEEIVGADYGSSTLFNVIANLQYEGCMLEDIVRACKQHGMDLEIFLEPLVRLYELEEIVCSCAANDYSIPEVVQILWKQKCGSVFITQALRANECGNKDLVLVYRDIGFSVLQTCRATGLRIWQVQFIRIVHRCNPLAR